MDRLYMSIDFNIIFIALFLWYILKQLNRIEIILKDIRDNKQ